LNVPAAPTSIPWSVLILIGKSVNDVVSDLKKFPAATVVLPTTNDSAFSDVPYNLFTSAPKFVALRFTPGFSCENPGIVILGVNEFFEIMATVCASTSSFTMLYDKSSVPVTDIGVAPVVSP